jgi:hypothetical protein
MVDNNDSPKRPIGSDATPTGQGLNRELSAIHQAHENRTSTFGAKDLEEVQRKVTALVKHLGSKATDNALLQRELASLGIPPEMAGVAYQMAQEQAAPNNFNIFSSQQYAFLDMGKTTEALKNGFTPASTKDLTFSTIVKSILG